MNISDFIAQWSKKRKVAQSETLIIQAEQVARVGMVFSIAEAIEHKKAIKSRQVLVKAMNNIQRMAYRIQREDTVSKGVREAAETAVYAELGKMLVDGLWGSIKRIAERAFGAVFRALRYVVYPVFRIFSSILVQTFKLAARVAITHPGLLAVAGVAALGYYLYSKYWSDSKTSVMTETGAPSGTPSGAGLLPPEFRAPSTERPTTVNGTPLDLYRAAVTESGLAEQISKGESGAASYEAANRQIKGKSEIITGAYDISGMSVADIMDLQAQGKLFAVGKYQITPEPLSNAVKALNIDPKNTLFDATTQEQIFHGYLLMGKRPQVHGYITGQVEDTEANLKAAGTALAKEWRALADPATGITYGGKKDARNKASVPWERVRDALKKARQLYMSKKGQSQPVASASSGWFIPASGTITSGFGTRTLNGKLEQHPGVDIAGPVGTPIYAAWAGKVQTAGAAGGYGNLVALDHGQGVTTLYGHNSRLLVSKGDTIARGQPIAEMGSTGYSTGSHLHFEIRHGTTAIDPVTYVPQLAMAKGTQVAAGTPPGPRNKKEYIAVNNKIVEVRS